MQKRIATARRELAKEPRSFPTHRPGLGAAFRGRATAGIVVGVHEELDLRGVKCPLSWARARVRLEALPRGTELELLLDDAQAARDIPRAAEACGYHVAGLVEGAGAWRLTIEA